MCHSPELSARHARISCQMAYYHRKHDPQFATQWEEARDHAVEMLHARVFQRCLEGDLEPIMFMGNPVGYIRKFSDKLQIEMLWALKSLAASSHGDQRQHRGSEERHFFVLTEEQRHELMRINREYLMTDANSDRRSAVTQCDASASATYKWRCATIANSLITSGIAPRSPH